MTSEIEGFSRFIANNKDKNLIARFLSGTAHKIRIKFKDGRMTDCTVPNLAFIHTEGDLEVELSKRNKPQKKPVYICENVYIYER